METIPKEECIQIGFIRKMHGVHGKLVLEFEPEFESSIVDSDRFFVELEGLLVPFFVSENGFRFKTSQSAILKFDWVDNETYGRRFIGQSVWLFKNEIVEVEDNFQVEMFTGFVVEDEKLGKIGEIISVEDFSGNLVLNVRHKNTEVLLPYNDEFLISLDEQQKILRLNLPDGLFDI